MNEQILKYVEVFNLENNQIVSGFGPVNKGLLKLEKDDYIGLYYFYPMIERLIRCILQLSGVFDLENSEQYTFKTLYSIITQNENRIKEVFGLELSDEILFYLQETYGEDGPRNKVMHYNQNAEIPDSALISAQYIFGLLIQFYVEHYCIP